MESIRKNFTQFRIRAVLAEWRKRLGIADEDIVIAFVGNLAPWQGIDDLIEIAFRLLFKEKKFKISYHR